MLSKNTEDWSGFLKIRNACTNQICKDKLLSRKKEAEQWNLEGTTAKIWKEVWWAVGWGTADMPTKIQVGLKVLKSPREIASAFAHFFRKKNQDMVANLGRPEIDPMAALAAGRERWEPGTGKECKL